MSEKETSRAKAIDKQIQEGAYEIWKTLKNYKPKKKAGVQEK